MSSALCPGKPDSPVFDNQRRTGNQPAAYKDPREAGVHQRPEQLPVAAGEIAVGDQVNDHFQLGIGMINIHGIVALIFERVDFGSGQAEQEEVLRAHFFANLDIGAVQGADSQRAIHAELHVAGAGGLFACG